MADAPANQTKRKPFQRDEEEVVSDIIRDFEEQIPWRNVHAQTWEETAQLLDPASCNTFMYGSWNWPGQKNTQRQIDASGMMAAERFAAICDSLLTPRNMKWHALAANNDYVMKDRATRLWFDLVTDILFRYRYSPLANFAGQNNANLRGLGIYGNATMFIDAFDGTMHHGAKGLRYKAVPLGQTFYRESHQGIVDSLIRWFRMTARQAAQKWGEDALPETMRSAYEKKTEFKYDFLHCVRPRMDYDRERLDAKGMPFSSHYVSMQGKCLMAPEGGFRSFPYATSRYVQAPHEVYGRGPAQMVLPALKTLNAQKSTFLKQGHRAADPVLLTADDGSLNLSLRPGAVNIGGVSPDGHPLVHVLPTGNIQVNEKMMEMERSLINDAFLVTLFQILTETPQMTATEVIERTNEKGILLAPTVGRQQSEYLGPMIEREIDILVSLRLIPPMPPRLREAQGEYEIVYTSPLARAQRAGEAAGFIRTVETAKEITNITQDPSYLDPFDFDTALPEIAQIQGVPERWMAPPEKIAQRRQARQKAAQQKAQIDALPAQAAMVKAQATVAKARPGIAPGEQGVGGPVPQGAA